MTGSEETAPEATGPERDAVAPGRRWSAVGGWVALVGGCLLLDGLVGGAVALVVAAVVAARLPPRVLGLLGAAAMAGAIAAVLVGGVPAEVDVSPAFVGRSLVPHHLTFAAFVLVGSWVVLDLVGHLRADPAGEPIAAPSGAPPRWVAVAVVAVVAVSAAVASAAVLWG